jgi:hypothetical protein
MHSTPAIVQLTVVVGPVPGFGIGCGSDIHDPSQSYRAESAVHGS